MLTLRPTGLSSPAYRDWLDYVIVEDGRDVGRIYEDRHSRPELRWYWFMLFFGHLRRRSLTGNIEIDEKRVLLSAISITILAATLNIGARYRDFDRRGRVVLEEQYIFLGNVVQR
jgi:hypothetical protein